MKFIITSAYGAVEAVRGYPHQGIDLAMPMDTPLRSFCAGIVEKVMHSGTVGNGVIVKAKDGARYIYGHLDSVNVSPGDSVSEGTLLGLSGNSGHSTGPHLHFAETVNGHYVDPSGVIDKVSNMAGGSAIPNFWHDPAGAIADHLRDQMQTAVLHWLSAAGDVALHLLYAGTLVGGGILILLRIVGFEHRWLRPGTLIMLYVIVRYLFGG